jgi:hypothetical protein
LTVVGFGPDPSKKYVTTYFRTTMNVVRSGTLRYFGSGLLVCDDGCVVYWNGYVAVLQGWEGPLGGFRSWTGWSGLGFVPGSDARALQLGLTLLLGTPCASPTLPPPPHP